MNVPVEWVPISAGAMISMDSGTKNLDWTARVLEKIIQFTQRGGIIHIIVHGINVGAQSYWNAEATMLMHLSTLIMTAQAAMVLTGKKALDFSGGVSAGNERGIRAKRSWVRMDKHSTRSPIFQKHTPSCLKSIGIPIVIPKRVKYRDCEATTSEIAFAYPIHR